ncbi:MAG: hypothetical protein Q8L53_16750 [Aestuariivirga sp.]|nr:hypothetical protein [Aestuariivirga sp.]
MPSIGLSIGRIHIRAGAAGGFSLTKPVLTLLTDGTDNTPLWGFDLTGPQAGDIIRIEWDDAIPYAAQVDFADYELTTDDLSGDFEFNFGLPQFANGDWSWRAYHIRGATTSPVSNEVSETLTGLDETAPVLSSPVDAADGATAGTGSVSTDEGNGTLYWVVSTSATPPSAAQVKAGQMHTGATAADSGSQAVSGTGVQNITGGFTGLTAETEYFAHYMQEDAEANQSNVASGDGFTTGAASTFSPLDLFASSEKGLWLDPSDLTSMFQLSNGTTAVASDADPVGYILDRTANAHALIQATDANRPLYKTSGGLHWLLFDGTNDSLAKATVNVTNNIGFLTIVVAADLTSEATIRTLLFFSNNASSARAWLSLTTSGFMSIQGRRLDADSSVTLSGGVDRGGAPGIFIAEIDYANSNANVHFSQTQDATSTSFLTDGNTSATDSGTLRLGGRTSSADMTDGKIFQALAIARELTSQEKADLGAYFAAKSGATW